LLVFILAQVIQTLKKKLALILLVAEMSSVGFAIRTCLSLERFIFGSVFATFKIHMSLLAVRFSDATLPAFDDV
jgi:hypothetical protein